MFRTFALEVELESRPDLIEIEVECEGSWQNDGIGPYEFWGQMCNDRGRNYIIIENTEWDSDGFTPEEIVIIEKAIDDKISAWTIEMEEDGLDCDE